MSGILLPLSVCAFHEPESVISCISNHPLLVVKVGALRGHTDNTLTRRDTFTYLLAESRCLAEEADILRQECVALRRAPFTMEAWVVYSLKLRAYRDLLANHTIAIKWTVNRRERFISASSQPSVSEPSAA